MDIGYARVSTLDQNPGLQLDALARAGCAPIFEERVTGVAKSRLVRDQALAQLRAGDTLTVWALDRLGRSTSETLAIVRGLDEHGIRFRCLTQPVDTSSAMGKMFIGFLAVMAEFERELLRERVLAGKPRAATPEGRPCSGSSATTRRSTRSRRPWYVKRAGGSWTRARPCPRSWRTGTSVISVPARRPAGGCPTCARF
jgi:DNA invertase Pin-like site-specific DNA recombinase